MLVRLAKRERLLESGIDPYPAGYDRTDTIAQVRAKYPGLAPDEATGDRVGVAGRVMLSRIGGKLCFATLRDGTGEIQVMISADRVGPDTLAAWKHDVDLGDHVGDERRHGVVQGGRGWPVHVGSRHMGQTGGPAGRSICPVTLKPKRS